MAGPWEKYQNAAASEAQAGPWMNYQPKDEGSPGLGASVLQALIGATKAFDSYTGAPTRAAIGAAQEGKNPLPAFKQQFGEDPNLAPSGKDIVMKAGVSGEPSTRYGVSPAGVLGVGMDMAANPINFLGPVAKGAGMAVKALPGVTRTGEAVSDAMGSLSAKAVGQLISKPKHAVEVYSGNTGEVNQLLDTFGNEIPVAADVMKKGIQDSIATTKRGLAEKITTALSDPMAPAVDSKPILEKLYKAKDAINPHYNPEDVKQIDEMIHAVQSNAPDGQLSLNNLFETRDFLRTRAQGSYVKNGDIFVSGSQAQKAAKAAASIAKDSLHEAAPPIREADAIYQQLHDIDNNISTNLLATGKSEGNLVSAGSGKPNVHSNMLNKIGAITGTDPVHSADILYAAKQFTNDPNLRSQGLSLLLTGKQGVSDFNNAATEIGLNPMGRAYNLLQGPTAIKELSRPYRNVAGEDNAMKRRLQGK